MHSSPPCNPDPKRYRLKKLRNKGYILVDRLWEKRRRKNRAAGLQIRPEKPLVAPRKKKEPIPAPILLWDMLK